MMVGPESEDEELKETGTALDSGKSEPEVSDSAGAEPERALEAEPEANSEPESALEANTEADSEADSKADTAADNGASSLKLTQVHVSHLLSDVLEDSVAEPPLRGGLRFPMILDLLLGAGLLVAMGGFTVGLFHMYLVHSAAQSISEQRYKAAIAILKGVPLPLVFARPGSDTEELLSKARYLDAMEKLEANTEIKEALKELGEIQPGSKYFALAQEAINEKTEPAPMMLQGGAETTETNPGPQEKQSLIEKTLKEND